eukprot:gene181-182_t
MKEEHPSLWQSPDAKEADSIKSIFAKNFWPDQSNNIGLSSMVPIFIVGMMRSGSTLLETMLDAHKDVVGIGEESVFNTALPPFRDELVAVMQGDNAMKMIQKVVKRYGEGIILNMTTKARRMSAQDGRTQKYKRIVDKMLFNYKNIGLIHLVFPNAVIIHTIRDPLDTLLSCYKHKFDDGGLEWSLDPVHLVSQYVQYLEIMHHFRTVLPGRVLDFSYEQLVADPEGSMREVMTAVKLPWDPSVLDFHRSNRTVQTHSMGQVRHGISPKAIGGWVRYARQMEPIISELK